VIALLRLGASPRRTWVAAGLAGAAAAAFLAVWAPPDDARLVLCAVRRFAHIACPGCGLTRALAALAHGDLAAALALHPLAPAVALQLVAGWLAWGGSLLAGRALPARLVTIVLVANTAAFLAVWIARMATGTLPD
jgi:Protein of unknown function (DUF2752)